MSAVPTGPASVVRLADYRNRKPLEFQITEPLDPSEPVPGLTWKSRVDRIGITIVVGGPVGDADRLALVDYLRDLADTFEGPPGEALFAMDREGA